MRREKVKHGDGGSRSVDSATMHVVLVEPYQSRKVAEAVAGHAGGQVVDVAQFPGGLPGTEGDYVGLLDADVRVIAQALAAGDHQAKK